MRLFHLMNLEHVALSLFPTLLFILVFALALAFTHLKGDDSEKRLAAVMDRYPEGLEDRNAPFPLAMTLIIAGTVFWVLGYIFYIGLGRVSI